MKKAKKTTKKATKKTKKIVKTCEMYGCKKKAVSRGMCSMHYQFVRYHKNNPDARVYDR